MNRSLRTISAMTAVAISLSACDKSSVTEDVLAQDSTLALAVLNANGDSIIQQADDSLSAAIGSGVLSGPVAANAQPAPKPVATASPAKPALSIDSEPRVERVAAATSATPTRRVRRTSVPASPRRAEVQRQAKVRTASRRVETVPTRAGRAPTRVATVDRTERSSTSSSSSRTPATRMSALVPAGSNIEFTSDNRVCSSNSAVGDTFTTRVAEDIIGPFGVVIPKGAVATAEVFTKKNDARTNSAADVGIRIQSVTVAGRTYPIESLVTSSDITKVRRSRNDAGKVITGAGLGAVLGRVIGHDTRSTVIGAVGGAAAGAVVARQTGKVESCIPDGGRITARLTEPLRVAVTE